MVFNYKDIPANYSPLKTLSSTFADAFQNGLNSNQNQQSTNSVWRYPTRAIDKSMDMLLIRIYRREDDPKNSFKTGMLEVCPTFCKYSTAASKSFNFVPFSFEKMIIESLNTNTVQIFTHNINTCTAVL